MKIKISEDELKALIKEGLLEMGLGNSAFAKELEDEDENQYESDFEDSLDAEGLPLSAIDMPIQDKAVFNQQGEYYDDEFSDIDGYKEFGNDYKENPQDLPSIAPGYFNENKNIIKITKDKLQEIIKEGVKKLHKQTIIENRLAQINQELNAINNTNAWDSARENAKEQLKKKNIAWQEITKRDVLKESHPSTLGKNNKKFTPGGSSEKHIKNFMDIETSILKKAESGDRAKTCREVPRESVDEIMSRAANLMAEAKKKYTDISKK